MRNAPFKELDSAVTAVESFTDALGRLLTLVAAVVATLLAIALQSECKGWSPWITIPTVIVSLISFTALALVIIFKMLRPLLARARKSEPARTLFEKVSVYALLVVASLLVVGISRLWFSSIHVAQQQVDIKALCQKYDA